MSELKAILKRNINHCDEKELGSNLCRILTDYCPTDLKWYFEDNLLSIRINLDEQSKMEQDLIIEFIEYLVDCSYINDYSDDTRVLTLSFTLSTLINKLRDVNEDGYVPVKIDRFMKYQTNDNCHNPKHIHIVDTKRLVHDLVNRGFSNEGIIFTAASPSEWVNQEIVDNVLELLNTERSFTKMIDTCINNED